MKLSVVSALLVACALADFEAPRYTVDLDKDPYSRWAPVASDLMSRHGYENAWGRLHALLERALPHSLWTELEPLWELLLESYPSEYQAEVRAFHRWMNEQPAAANSWTLGQVTMVQIFYEVEDACTSIVTQHSNGTIYHARNLDYGLPGLENFTATITFQRDGHPVSRGTMYVGYAGLLTGQHLSGNQATWSVSLDQRFLSKKYVPYVPTIKAILAGVQNVGFTLRNALTELDDFTSATNLLRTQQIPAPAYLIAAGVAPGEGVIITRDRNGTAAARGTGRGYWPLDPASGGWYRVETNFDNWLPFADGRRGAAHRALDKLGQDQADSDGLLGVLSTPPVLAEDTTYTATIVNAAGEYSTLVRSHTSNERREAKKIAEVSRKLQVRMIFNCVLSNLTVT